MDNNISPQQLPPQPPNPPPLPRIPKHKKIAIVCTNARKCKESHTEKQHQKEMQFQLVRAIAEGDIHRVSNLIQKGVIVNISILYSKTPLSYALEQSNEEIALLLLQCGADPENVACVENSHNQMKPLHIAVENNCFNVVQRLIELKVDINCTDGCGLTPLHYASYYGLQKITELLLTNGANVKSRDMIDRMPFHRAMENCSLQVAKFLLEHGADINATDKFNMTPLMFAAFLNDIPAAKFLLNNCCQVNATNTSSALHFVCNKLFSVSNNFESTYFHKFKGSDGEKIRAQNDIYVRNVQVSVEFVDLLINAGARLEQCKKYYTSQLCCALLYLHTLEEKSHMIDAFVCSGLWISDSLLQDWRPTANNDIETYHLLCQFHKEQTGLKFQCRRKIRECLAVTRDIDMSIDKLELPKSLKAYLRV